MRWIWCITLLALVATGCASGRARTNAAGTSLGPDGTPRPAPIITPGGSVAGRVASVNPNGRFVVLSYPLGGLPPIERRLFVYRGGLKVGEVRVSRWQLDNLAVADILGGECRVGDESREE